MSPFMPDQYFLQEQIWSTFRLIIVFTFVLIIVKIVWRHKGSDKNQEAEEVRMIQEMYQGLEKMESRVESLETILLKGERKEGK